MKGAEHVCAGGKIIPITRIRSVDVSQIEQGRVTVHHEDGQDTAEGFFAIEIVMALKPSALEGKRLKWIRHAWARHNLVSHPLMQLLAFAGGITGNRWFYKKMMEVHDESIPVPHGFREE